jgi:hypothetical protein
MSVNDYDVDLYEAVRDLVDEDLLEEGTPAYGIAQQVVHLGYDSLSPKQRTLYNAVVIPALKERGEELAIMRHQDVMRGAG